LLSEQEALSRQAPMSFGRHAGYTHEVGPLSTRHQEDRMLPLTGKSMVVIGGSRGVGRRIVEAAIRNDARVLAVARQESPLRQLAQEVSGTEVLSLDATDEGAPSKVFDVLQPDILFLGGRVSARRAATRAELAGVRRQLGE
jgi:NAD(P)-dependent dehydrogenase (short-subunit alcohol dehydrogenase family)